jgi:hypothetical protein
MGKVGKTGLYTQQPMISLEAYDNAIYKKLSRVSLFHRRMSDFKGGYPQPLILNGAVTQSESNADLIRSRDCHSQQRQFVPSRIGEIFFAQVLDHARQLGQHIRLGHKAEQIAGRRPSGPDCTTIGCVDLRVVSARQVT